MRSEFIRIYKAVHTWTGILTGLLLFIAFYAGAITVFKEPLTSWATPPTASTTTARAVPLSEAQTLIARTLASHPEVAHEFRLRLTDTDKKRGLLEWEVRDKGANEHDPLSAHHFIATLNTDGTAHVEDVERSHLADFIDVLHRVVGLPVDNDLSRYFMGAVAALYFLALVSGIVVLLPSLTKDLFALRVGPNLKRMWLDAHNVVGLGSLPFHLVMALTATVFAFHDPIYLVQNQLIHGGKLGAMFRDGDGSGAKQPRDPTAMLSPVELMARVTELAPDFEPEALHYRQVTGPRPVVLVVGHDTRGLEPRAIGGFAMLDPYRGQVVTTEYLPGHESAGGTVLTSLFALHFGTYGGAPVKWMYFFLALLGAWLFYSGNLLWIESRRRRTKQRVANGAIPVQSRNTRWMASATVGVCLGAVCGISLTVVSAKLLHACVADINDWYRVVYYAAFFSAIGWSFSRGGARASVDLLCVAAALTAAIPLTTLTAAALPSLGLWAHTAPASLGVDLTALGAALAFAWMARQAARRVYEGPADSVWSARAPLTASDGTPGNGNAMVRRERRTSEGSPSL